MSVRHEHAATLDGCEAWIVTDHEGGRDIDLQIATPENGIRLSWEDIDKLHALKVRLHHLGPVCDTETSNA